MHQEANTPKAVLYCFSGTGNTHHAVTLVARDLRQAGWETDIRIMADDNTPIEPVPALTLIAYPVYAWTLPVLVRRFIKRLPDGQKANAAVLATWGGHPGSALDAGASLLRRKNYRIIQTHGALYPDNWTQAVNPPDAVRAAEMIRMGDVMSQEYANALIECTERHFSYPVSMRMIAPVSFLFSVLGRRILGSVFYADSSCTGCGLCEKTCPVHNIRNASGKHPEWKFACEACNRCINLCPTKAINTSTTRILGMVILAVLLTLFSVLCDPALKTLLPIVPGWLRITGWILLDHLLLFFLSIYTLLPGLRLLEKRFGKAMDKSFTKTYNRYHFPN